MKHTIGKRLAYVREQLSADDPKTNWTQAKVAEETGLKQNMITRIEHTGAGTFDAFRCVLLLYHSKGFNIRWILLEDNTAEPLYIGDKAERSSSRAFILSIKQQLEGFLAGVEEESKP